MKLILVHINMIKVHTLCTLCILVYLSSFLAIDSLQTVVADSQKQNSIATSPTQNQPPVSWKDFKDRNGLFTVISSNWFPSPRHVGESAGPIDFMVKYQDQKDRFAMLGIIQPPGIPLFTTSKDVVDSIVASFLGEPGISLQRQAECGNVKLNGLPACDFIILDSDPAGPNKHPLKILTVHAVDPSGTEYHAQYLATPDVFDFFYPTVKHMVESFKTTPVVGNNPMKSTS